MDETRHRWQGVGAGLLAALILGACERENPLQFDPGPGDPGPGGAPLVAGPARYEDRNGNHTADADDVLIVPFSTRVVLNGVAVPAADVFAWPDWFGSCELDNRDSFGADASLAPGPAANEITITLGNGARLKTRHAFVEDCNEVDEDPASGIDLLGATSVIENPVDGSGAEPSTLTDIVPGFVEGGALANNSTRAVLLIDVDGDADLDLLVGNAEGEADELWRNDGAGAFQLRQLFGTSDTRALAAGDLDGDGDPDLVVADGRAPNMVWKSDEGFFFLPETIDDVCSDSGGCPTRDVALADVDRDGDLDLVEGNWNEPNLLQINEEGTLGGSIEIGLGVTSCVALDDLDLDGDPDLVVGGDSDGDQVWINVNGNFVDSLQRLGLGATSSVALGDLDLDGDPDLVVGDGGAGDQVWTNLHGNFVDSGQRLGSGATSDVALADFDQDGAPDLVATVRGGGNRFWLNDRSGTFVDSRQSLGTAITSALALGDVDGDGDLDFVAGNEDGPNQIWLQSLAGTWGDATLTRLSPTLDAPPLFEVSAVDIDQDGDADLVATAAAVGQDGSIWRNDGSGAFTQAQTLALPDNTVSRSIAVGDIDGDGDPDLIQGRGAEETGGTSTDQVWNNNGTGSFALSATQPFSASHDSWDVKLVDLDGNGALDYVYTHDEASATSGIKVWTNQGGTFTDTTQTLGAGTTVALTIGDVDADGFPDLIESYSVQDGRVWLNDGTARFVQGDSMALAANTANVLGLALGDLDGDGDLDLVSTDQDSARGNHVWDNEGNGDFTEDSTQLLKVTGVVFISVVLADIDGDGDLDVVGGGFDLSKTHAWFRNDGAGGFGSATTFNSTEDQARGMTAADVDRDGDVDILGAIGTRRPGLEVWFNR